MYNWMGIVQVSQKLIGEIGKFVHTYLCRFATIHIVKTPNTLYSFCYTPQKLFNEIPSPKRQQLSGCLFHYRGSKEITHKGTDGDFMSCFLLFCEQFVVKICVL